MFRLICSTTLGLTRASFVTTGGDCETVRDLVQFVTGMTANPAVPDVSARGSALNNIDDVDNLPGPPLEQLGTRHRQAGDSRLAV